MDGGLDPVGAIALCDNDVEVASQGYFGSWWMKGLRRESPTAQSQASALASRRAALSAHAMAADVAVASRANVSVSPG